MTYRAVGHVPHDTPPDWVMAAPLLSAPLCSESTGPVILARGLRSKYHWDSDQKEKQLVVPGRGQHALSGQLVTML